MTDDERGDERDPLLVRPYLLRDAGSDTGADTGAGAAAGDARSTQTWPSATTREVRSQHALEGADDPTEILLLPAPPRARHGRRRALVLIAVCAAVLLGATAAGFAVLRPGGRPAVSAALPDAPIPALSGLVPASPTAPPAKASASATPASRKPTARPASSSPSATSATSASATRSAVAPAPAATNGKTSQAALAPLAPAAARTGTIRGQNGLCLDLNGEVAVDFNQVQVLGCDGGAAQSWTLAADGTLRVLGMCALTVGDNSVRITTCDGRTTAQWSVSGQQLINAADGKCLTDPSTGTRSGTAVTVTTCGGGAGQRWSLP